MIVEVVRGVPYQSRGVVLKWTSNFSLFFFVVREHTNTGLLCEGPQTGRAPHEDLHPRVQRNRNWKFLVVQRRSHVSFAVRNEPRHL